MKKTVRRVALMLLFALTSLVAGGCSEEGDVTSVAPPVAEPAKSVSADSPAVGQETASGSVEVVYFHIANPCDCMAAVGEAIAYSINTYFQAELSSGVLSFVDVVSDDAANQEIVEAFGGQPSDLFVVTRTGDETFVEPDYEIWNLMGDNEAISQYVKGVVEAKLAGLPS